MDRERLAVCVIFGLGAVVLVYAAVNAVGSQNPIVPGIQGEAQVMGLGVNAGIDLSSGTPLDMNPGIHFWAPGSNPRDMDSPQPVVQCRHRYPAIPGGNVTTVMHKGWSSLVKDAPSGNDWRLNPPEVAVL
jgi:hypothetical protein